MSASYRLTRSWRWKEHRLRCHHMVEAGFLQAGSFAPTSSSSPPPLSSLPLVSQSVFVRGLFVCGMWGKQSDSPESRQQTPNTRHLTSVSQNVHSDVWLLTVRPEACREGGGRREEKEREEGEEEVNSWGSHGLPYGRWTESSLYCSSLQCISIVLTISTVLCAW